jgi:hypothetical protein
MNSKATRNDRKHGVDRLVFDDPNAIDLEEPDDDGELPGQARP